MPNTLGFYNPQFYANETLIHLERVLGMAQRVHMGYDAERRSVDRGEYINIKKPATFVAQEGSITSQDLATESLQIQVNRYPEVRFEVTDQELAYTGEQIISDHIEPAAYALANHLDQSLIALYKDVPWLYDYGSATDHQVVTGMYKVAFDNGAPMMSPGWHLMVDGTVQMGFQNSDMFKSADTTGQGANQTLFNGTLGTRYGVEIFANQNVTHAATHVPGTANQAAGDSVMAVNSDPLAKGATTMMVDGGTGSETIKAGDTFVIAGNSQRYAVTGDITLGTGSHAAMTFTPPAVQEYEDGDVITFTKQPDAGSAQQLLFHRNAFALAFATLPSNLPGIEVATATHPRTGLSVRARRWTDGASKKTLVGLDMLYGVKTLDPNLAVRGYT